MSKEPDNREMITHLKDRIITKDIESYGEYGLYPAVGAECTVDITNISFEDENGACAVDKHSRYFSDNFDGKIIIGEADSFVDFDLERCLQRMACGEISSLCLWYTNIDQTKFKQIKCRVQINAMITKEPISSWTWDTLYLSARTHKERGVELVKQNRIADAFRKFAAGCKFLISADDIPVEKTKECLDLKVKLMNNIAHCQLHYREYAATVSLCNRVLQVESDNVKALFRRGSAYMALEDWESAYEDMSKVVQSSPKDPKALQNLAILKNKMKVINDEYKNVIKKMFT